MVTCRFITEDYTTFKPKLVIEPELVTFRTDAYQLSYLGGNPLCTLLRPLAQSAKILLKDLFDSKYFFQ